MIDDSPFPDDQPAPEPTGEPAAPAQPAVGLEQLGAFMAKTMEPTLNALNQRLAAIEQRAQAPAPQPQSKAGGDKPLLDRFVEDPDAVLREHGERVRQETLQAVAPYLHGPAAAAQETAISTEKQRIDSRWGEGTFDTVVRPHLDEALQTMPEALRFNPRALQTSIAAIVGSGRLQGELDQRREAYLKAQRERQRAAPANPFGRPTTTGQGGGVDITEDDREVLKSLEKAGFGMSEAELKAVRSMPKGADLDTMLDLFDKAPGVKPGRSAA